MTDSKGTSFRDAGELDRWSRYAAAALLSTAGEQQGSIRAGVLADELLAEERRRSRQLLEGRRGAEAPNSGVRKDKSTPSNRKFWDDVEEAAETVSSWPAWKRGGDLAYIYGDEQ